MLTFRDNELANITLDTGASYIYHEEGERYIPVKFSVRDRDLGGAVAEAQQHIAQNVKLPSGYRLVWAGEFEDLENAKARLEMIIPISLLLILALLYALFNSLRDSLMALAGIPFAAGGGILALLSDRFEFQHLGGDRIRLVVRRLSHEWHFDHDIFQ